MIMILEALMTLAFEIVGPCEKKPLFSSQEQSKVNSLGLLTIDVLEKNNIPYQGSEKGLNSIYQTPVGLAAIEVISDQEMRSFGWCFEIDGVTPEVYPDEVALKDVKKVTWFFGFAHFKNGQWVSQCEKAWKVKPKFLCR
jgi:hypothetical protein